MPINPTYPGVYIEEIPSGVRTIRGVATSIGAFVGTFRRGLLNEAVRVQSLSDFEREYGGLDRDSEASYGVQQFFLNGGTDAWLIRVGHPGDPDPSIDAIAEATAELRSAVGAGNILLDVSAGRRIRGESATNPGDWGNFLRLEVSHNTSADDTTFNLTVSEVQISGDRTTTVQQEVFRNLTMQPNRANNAIEVINEGSRLVQVAANFAPVDDEDLPHVTGTLGDDIDPAANFAALSGLPVVTEIDDISVTVQLGAAPSPADIGPIPLDFTGAADPASFEAWAILFQERLRAAALDPAVPVALRPYLSGAVVTLLGDGSADEPWRMHVRSGQGAQPFLPETVLVFGGVGPANDAPNYGLAAPIHSGPQQIALGGGNNGSVVDPATGVYLVPESAFSGNPALRTGIYALEDVDLFNILCIPDAPRLGTDGARALYGETINYVTERRAMLILDIPEARNNVDAMQTWLGENAGLRAANSAVYFPRTVLPDPLNRNRPRSIAASGTMAGVWARTDSERGVWKAPAGTDARLRGLAALSFGLTDAQNGILNPLGVNCLRTFPIYGPVCWGARTMEGADQIASDWKYLPVRRMTLFLEESLYRGTQWVVFEPNDEPLWAQIRINVGALMHDLFRKGAFQGAMPSDAYLVKCDAETTTQTDIDNGIVNIEVGFAPLKPAEFVIIRIQQIARRAES